MAMMNEETELKVQEWTMELASWLLGAQEIINKHFAANCPQNQVPKLELQAGPRYVKVVRREKGFEGGSVHCFIDRRNGDVLKAAGWSKPAKHARGNIFDAQNGLGMMQWTGPAYLR